MNLELICAFDEFLKSKKLTFEGVAIGGGALIILEVISRVTRDIDVLSTEIQEKLVQQWSYFTTKRSGQSLATSSTRNFPREISDSLYAGKS